MAASLAAAVTLVGACGDDATDRADAVEDAGPLESMLTVVPASLVRDDGHGNTPMIVIGDLAAAAEQRGIVRPDHDEPPGPVLNRWIIDMRGGPAGGASTGIAAVFPSFTRPMSVDDFASFDAEIGWSLPDIDRYVQVESEPQFAAMALRVDAAEITAAVGEPVDGVWSIGEEGQTSLDERTAARPLGEAVRMATRDGVVLVAATTAAAREWLDAPAEQPTLYDDPALATIVRTLDQAGVYQAHLVTPLDFTTMFERANPRATQAKLDERLAGPIPSGFERLGVGVSYRDGIVLGTFVYGYADESAAERDEPILRSVFTEGISIRGARHLSELWTLRSVVRSGAFVTVTVDAFSPHVVQDMVFHDDVVMLTR